MFYAIFGLSGLRALATLGIKWAKAEYDSRTKEDEPTQADDNYVDKATKDNK